MAGRDTKGRILAAAVRLFNERGTAAVSTNHVAEEAGISPGNLYYHFRNKEEIVRGIWARIDAAWDEAFALPEGRKPSLRDMRAMMERTYAMLWEYRFFYRELGALTRRDPELREAYRAVRERGLRGTEELLRGFTASGVLERDEDALPGLAKVLWLLAEYWLPFEAAAGEDPGPEGVREGAGLMMRVLEPRLTPAARAGLEDVGREARIGGER